MKDGEVTKIEYGGEEYSKVDGEAKAGDLVQSKERGNDVTEGGYYEVNNVLPIGSVSIKDDVNDRHDRYRDSVVVFRKKSKPQDFSVGDRVKLSVDSEPRY